MTLDTFFDKFELFADMPVAVTKLRELVLRLAFAGRLFGDIGTNTGLASFDASAAEQTVGDHIEFLNGYAFKSEWFRPSGIRLCRNVNVGHGTLDWRESAFVDKQIADEFSRFTLNDGDVVLSLDRPLISTGLKVARVTKADLPCLLLQRVAKPVPKHDQLDMSYFLLWLNSPEFVDTIDPGRSNGVPHISTRQVQRLRFNLPPLAEQKRIVAKVDELMALCDRLEAQQQDRDTRHAALARASLARFADDPSPANLEYLFHPAYAITPTELRNGILTLAVQGKLVSQDPDDEPAAMSLSRLGLKSTLVVENDVENVYEAMPPSWTRVRFEDVATVSGGVTLGRKLVGKKTVALPYLRVANVKRGVIDLTVIKEVSIGEDEIERYALKDNDLLMTEGGDWDKVGRAAIWHGQISKCLHQNHVFRARMRSDQIMPLWFERYFNSPVGRSYFESASKQTTNLASINMRQVRGCVIPLPPLAEQRRIVAKVDQLMALADQLETQLAASRAAAETLMEAVVAELTAAAAL